jgi:hypothetical protein
MRCHATGREPTIGVHTGGHRIWSDVSDEASLDHVRPCLIGRVGADDLDGRADDAASEGCGGGDVGAGRLSEGVTPPHFLIAGAFAMGSVYGTPEA